jgi:hypothetical protein
MKKLLVFGLAVLLVAAFTVPAAAFDSEFGGYWRARAFMQENFTGEDETEAGDLTRTDTRTRLYYTAVFSDDFKFVNKFEFNTVFGDTDGGDIGADGNTFRVKNSYANFNTGAYNWLVGIQPRVLARGLLMDDDFSGLVVTYQGDDMSVPFIWMKAYEGGALDGEDDQDVDYYGLNPKFNLSDSLMLNPYLLYITSDDALGWTGPLGNEEVGVYYLGLDLDKKFEGASLWFTGIYSGGEVDDSVGDSYDVSAYLAALGGDIDLGSAVVSGQVFYATGDDDPTDDEFTDFYMPDGNSYYWSEIMGLGVFDNTASAGSPGDAITNIMAANVGVSFSTSENWTWDADLWYAALAEDNAAGDSDLGIEIDLKATTTLMEGLKLELVAAYLSAGEATYDGDDEADPIEVGARLSFSF